MRKRKKQRRARSGRRRRSWGALDLTSVPTPGDPCALGRIATCPYREACDRDAIAWSNARTGSRSDFDAVYAAWFDRCYRLALRRVGNRRVAEACTRDVLALAFSLPAPFEGCTAAQLLGLLARRLSKEEGGA